MSCVKSRNIVVRVGSMTRSPVRAVATALSLTWHYAEKCFYHPAWRDRGTEAMTCGWKIPVATGRAEIMRSDQFDRWSGNSERSNRETGDDRVFDIVRYGHPIPYATISRLSCW